MYPSFAGMSCIIKQIYTDLCACNVQFRGAIPASCFSYYCAVITWARALHLMRSNGNHINKEEHILVDLVYNPEERFIVPKSYGSYLSMFGNTYLPSGIPVQFALIKPQYDVNSFFVGLGTKPGHCAAYPCLAIYMQRIIQDLLYTDNSALGPIWFVNGIERKWNNRCLGYEPAKKLQPCVRRHIGKLVLGSNHNSVSEMGCKVSPISPRLLKYVQNHLMQIANLEIMRVPDSRIGSIGQVLASSVQSIPTDCDNIGDVEIVTRSPFSVTGSFNYFCGSFMARLEKRAAKLEPHVLRFLYPWTYPSDEVPSLDERADLGFLNDEWNSRDYDSITFETAAYKPLDMISEICSKDERL